MAMGQSKKAKIYENFSTKEKETTYDEQSNVVRE
jgi:hypothetical protein